MDDLRITYKTWRPASVRLPDGTVLHRHAVYLASHALEVYGKPGEPVFSSPVDFSATPEPRRTANHVGIDIETEAGTVVVTPTGGCTSCGSPMRGWAPAYAHQVAAWPLPEGMET